MEKPEELEGSKKVEEAQPPTNTTEAQQPTSERRDWTRSWLLNFFQAFIMSLAMHYILNWAEGRSQPKCSQNPPLSLSPVPREAPGHCPFGTFPREGAFHWIPCTAATQQRPSIDDVHSDEKWAQQYDADPAHWRWGNKTANEKAGEASDWPYAGRGLCYCGYFDINGKRAMAYMYDSAGLTPAASCGGPTATSQSAETSGPMLDITITFPDALPTST